MSSTAIASVHARQIFDSKCRPIIEVDVRTAGGHMGRGSASTGTSVGSHEAAMLQDGDPTRFEGKSVYRAVENVNSVIGPALLDMDVLEQRAIDYKMIGLDGTPDKSLLGSNAIYAVSIACIKAAAAANHLQLYQYLAAGPLATLPVPTFNSINGGVYPDFTMNIQEFTFCPYKARSMGEAVEIAMRVFPAIGEVIARYQRGKPAVVGKYYSWQTPNEDPFVAMELLHEAVCRCGYQDKVAYALDFASSEVYDKERDRYYCNGDYLTRQEMLDQAKRLTRQYPFLYIEDVLDENDWEGYRMAVEQIDRSIVIGDDLIVTNLQRLQKAHRMNAAEGFIFKPNQVGTVTEAVQARQFAAEHGLLTISSQRGGGTVWDTVVELGIGLEIEATKSCASRGGESIYAMNAIYRAEDEYPDAAMFDFTPWCGFEPGID